MMIDSNIIIYALNLDSPKCKIAQQFLRQQKKFALAHQSVLESLRVITHPNFPTPYPQKKALKELEIILAHARVVVPKSATLTVALELIEKYDIKGPEVFDAYLVATALSNGINQIATDNVKHLGKYTEIHVVNPFI